MMLIIFAQYCCLFILLFYTLDFEMTWITIMAFNTNMSSPFVTVDTLTIRWFDIWCNILMHAWCVYSSSTNLVDKSWSVLQGGGLVKMRCYIIMIYSTVVFLMMLCNMQVNWDPWSQFREVLCFWTTKWTKALTFFFSCHTNKDNNNNDL